MFRQHQVPYWWKRVRDITTTWLSRICLKGIGLASKVQRGHLTIRDPIREAPSCPTKQSWTSTGEVGFRGAQRVKAATSRGADFSSCQPSEIIYAANIKLKLEYTYCILAKRFQAWLAYQKIRCSNIRALDNTDKPDIGWQAQYLIFTRGEILYSLKCRSRKPYVAADWETQAYYQELTVWIYTANHHKKLQSLMPGPRLLLNSPHPKNCTQERPILRGYLGTLGKGILLTPDLNISRAHQRQFCPN